MPVDFAKARDFVYRTGTLLERALFAWLFDDGSLERLHQIIRCYKNHDNGFGHGLEHDLKAPESNPLALEYLLGVMKHTDMPAGSVLDGTADWVESQMNADGSLRNPPTTRDYPLEWWWQDQGGQTMPDSIVGNLIRFDRATPSLVEKTKRWALAQHSPASIWRTNGFSWLITLSTFSSPSRICRAWMTCARRQSRMSSLAPWPRPITRSTRSSPLRRHRTR